MPSCDVAIVGAGPAGSATAALLAERGYSVVLLDRERFPRDKPCAEYLSPEARRVLDGLLPEGALAAAEPAQLDGMRVVSPNGTSFEGRFRAGHRFRGYAEQGLALPRSVLDTMLVEAAAARGAELLERTTFESIGPTTMGRRTIRLRQRHGANRVSARVVIGADGLHSRVARQLGLARRGRLSRVALVAHATGVTGMRQVGEMHVDKDGYIGLAPIGRGLTNVSVVVDTKRFAREGKSADWFARAIGRFPELSDRLAGAEYVTPFRGAGPFARRTTRATGDRVALVGDAADFYDPFTGEGIYAALHGAELLAARLNEALESDHLDARDLRAYDRARRRAFGSKWVVERIIAAVVRHPAALDHVATRLGAKPDLADLLVGVTGDFVPPTQLFRPAFARQLIW